MTQDRNVFQGQKPQGCPTTTKLRNKNGNSLIYVMRFCAKASGHQNENISSHIEKM
jgi:hypothetical protein